ncbi:hypothetical protein [Peribacillus glennii]|uniref:Uncharacterized protein n=1 Tax=Peribacillus glennii TaxID=2303991 RepID=A0A372L904_9BACI|nr:hypothetical protein [Peribacillus glennii]RFU61611.1 hypothetical protein D0466_17580 [Peribacillus glennii]
MYPSIFSYPNNQPLPIDPPCRYPHMAHYRSIYNPNTLPYLPVDKQASPKHQPPFDPFRQQYPPVDIKVFTESIHTFQFLMQQGGILLGKLSNPDFSYKLMELAQRGKQREVDALIQTIGLQVRVSTAFTPTGVIFTIRPKGQQDGQDCCTLTVAMKWEK